MQISNLNENTRTLHFTANYLEDDFSENVHRERI